MSGFHPVDHFLLVLIVLVWPLYVALYRFPRLRRDLATGLASARLKAYGEGIVFEWVLLGITLGLWFVLGRSAEGIGLGISEGWRLGLGAVVLVVVIVLLNIQRHKILGDDELQGQLEKSLHHISPLLPTNSRELAVFHGLSITAGICEEIIYRGYVMWYITEVTGVVGAVILSAALFGLAHAYQGTRGMVQTGLVGLALAVIFVLTETLWIPILLHAFLDINSGRLAYGMIRRKAAQASSHEDMDHPEEGA